MAGRSTRAAVWWEDAQGSVDRATMAKHTPFLVAGSGYSDYPLAQSSQLPDRVLAMDCTDVDNGERSSVAGQDNAVAGRAVAGRHLQVQSLRRGRQ